VSFGGTELNPVAAWSLRHGIGAFVAVKVVLASVLVLLIPFLERERGALRGATWTCAGLDVLFGGVVASNLLQVLLFA
jgi:hypothetical protein